LLRKVIRYPGLAYFSPTSNLDNTRSFDAEFDKLPEHVWEQYSAEVRKQMRELTSRVAAIALLINDKRVHLPFSVVHSTRVD
jgi:hypothetical protein